MKKWTLAALAFWSCAALCSVEIGKPAPDFTLTGSDGKIYKLSTMTKDAKNGSVVVLEWYNPGCPFVRRHYSSGNMQSLQQTFTGQGVKWFTIASSAPGKEGHIDSVADAAQMVTKAQMKNTAILLDTKQEVAKAYEAKTTPHMFVINKKGLLVYNGALDSKSTAAQMKLADYQNDSKIEKYVVEAVAAAEKDGMPVKTTTEPYGCSVKY